MTLAEKLHAIQKLAKRVPVRGVHERGWKYMRVQEIVTVGTKFLTEHNLILIPTIKSLTRSEGKSGGSIVDLMVTWTLADVTFNPMPNGAMAREFDIPGSGFDYDSKGTAKALTDSRKNAMILLFNLKAGDDPERAPMTRHESKQSREDVVERKLADAADGKGIDASVPKIFYEIFEQSQTVELTGDKNLLKAPSLKKYKLGGKFVVKSAEWDKLRETMENEGIAVSNLRTQ